MTIPKSYEALAADLASEKIISKTLQGQKEAYMMLADKGRLDLSESETRETTLREEIELQKNHFKIRLQGAKDADSIQQRLTFAEKRIGELEVLLQMFVDNSDDKDVVELSEHALKLVEA